MWRLIVFLYLFSGLVFAQGNAEKAPPEVDQALRERIGKFYQAHVDGKFRAADQFVAEDSKDYFFGASKRRYLSYEIQDITYSDNFTRAKATVQCEFEVMMPGVGKMIKMKMPRPSLWKIVDGQWYWYVDPNAPVVTPFGVMQPRSAPSAGAPAAPLTPPKGPGIEGIQKLVKADKQVVRLSSDAPSEDQVTISNSMPGAVTLTLQVPAVPGLEAKLDRTQLAQQQTARLSVAYTPKEKGPKPPALLSVTVVPTNQVIPLRIVFRPPDAASAKPTK